MAALTVLVTPGVRMDDIDKPVGLLPARRIDYDLMRERLKPGVKYKAKITQARSRPAHNFYFGVIEAAAMYWPKRDEPHPEGDAKLLRAWLQCKAGPKWRKNVDGPPDSYEFALKMIEALAGDGRYAFVDSVITTDKGPVLRVHVPLSINWDEMPEGSGAFGELRQEVFDIIELKFHMTVHELVAHAEAVI